MRIRWSRVAICGAILGLTGCGTFVNQDAARRLRADLGQTTITVLPVFVRAGTAGEYDSADAARLAHFLETSRFGSASVSREGAPIKGGWHMNEGRMLRESAADVSRFVERGRPEAAYVAYAEYLLNARGRVVAVHLTVHDRHGRVAYARVVNSHAQLFKDLKPAGRTGCMPLVMRALVEDLGHQR